MTEFKPFITFVYGTLQYGFSNHGRLGGSKYLGDGELTTSYLMYNGGFPYLAEAKGPADGKWLGYPIGELYLVEDKNIAEGLDRLEGVPHLYVRKEDQAQCYWNDEYVDVIVYVASEGTRMSLLDTRVPMEPSAERTHSWPASGL